MFPQIVLTQGTESSSAAWATVVLTGCAFVAAGWAARSAHHTLRLSQEQARRTQASQVAAWAYLSPSRHNEIKIRNASTLPVYDVQLHSAQYFNWRRVKVLNYGHTSPEDFEGNLTQIVSVKPDDHQITIASVEPASTYYLRVEFDGQRDVDKGPHFRDGKTYPLQTTFVDADGNTWSRGDHGALTLVSPPKPAKVHGFALGPWRIIRTPRP